MWRIEGLDPVAPPEPLARTRLRSPPAAVLVEEQDELLDLRRD
ncbi:MAG TPA: hypothetical protein VFA98_10225 [Thermoanaerobaculia bacterium]|nr:hypothetical protein [Thermoanaerobaculia bacterium]